MSEWTSRPAEHWPELPYPGERPGGSWRLIGTDVHRLIWVGHAWVDASTGDTVDLNNWVFLLAYGSNANPVKIAAGGFRDVVMLDATITDGHAVWCNARRTVRDHSVVATIAKVQGHQERCPVMVVHRGDERRVERWEGTAYERRPFWGRCELTNGVVIAPDVYVGGPNRQPLLDGDGSYLGLHEYGHAYVDQIVR